MKAARTAGGRGLSLWVRCAVPLELERVWCSRALHPPETACDCMYACVPPTVVCVCVNPTRRDGDTPRGDSREPRSPELLRPPTPHRSSEFAHVRRGRVVVVKDSERPGSDEGWARYDSRDDTSLPRTPNRTLSPVCRPCRPCRYNLSTLSRLLSTNSRLPFVDLLLTPCRPLPTLST